MCKSVQRCSDHMIVPASLIVLIFVLSQMVLIVVVSLMVLIFVLSQKGLMFVHSLMVLILLSL